MLMLTETLRRKHHRKQTIVSHSDPVNIGVLFSTTGITAAIERTQLAATLFAIDEVNQSGGINGRELVPVHADPQSQAMRYRELAVEMIGEHKIQVLFGCYMSSSRKAVLPVVEKWNRLLFYPTLYEGFEFSPNVIYTGAAPNQNSVPLAEYMLQHFGPRVYMVGSDYIYPYESNRIMSDLVLQHRGGRKLGERYLKLGAARADLDKVIADIRDRQPDFIFSTVVGEDTALLYQAYADAGLDPARMPIASLTTSEAEVLAMGAGVAAGHYTSAPYFQSVDRASNRDCLAKFMRFSKADIAPNLCWEAAYFQVHLFANAMRQSGSDEIERLMPCLLGSEFDAPQGRVKIDARTHHTVLYPRIGRAETDGQFRVLAQASAGMLPDPYLVSHALHDWSATTLGQVAHA